MRITIIGIGLIGGSIGLALKRAWQKEVELIGYARDPNKGARAVELGAVDWVVSDLASAVTQSEVIFIAAPALVMEDILEQIGKHLPSGCIVTDTVSTKGKVMEWAEKYLPQGVDFIGGHPMAGKEQSGIETAEASLFEGCTYCLVPGNNVSYTSVQRIDDLVKQIGGRPLVLTAQEHDKFVAGISHLPLLISVALVSATTNSPSWVRMSELAATGYRDLTRLASQDPTMDRDICLTNQENIINWIDEFTDELRQIRSMIASGSRELEELFIRARQARQRWLGEYDKKD